ncbi:helix-turn-helix domain-containing protein [Actinoplanes sp. NPDC026623]|uniref:nSTAND1 domain-containing NTPase n=1 Tax=Actinoplanes sp. NPDC026623 TaxID=3155610 RepID=UPI003410AF3D
MTRDDFGRELTLLRQGAGLSVRQVAAQTGSYRNHSTIGDWFAGRGLPAAASRELLVQVLRACGVTDPVPLAAWVAVWQRLRQTPGPRPLGPEPYRGLASFEPEHADWFFGREALTAELIDRLAAGYAAGGGMQIVVGASGSGKSSLLRAGLIHAVLGGRLAGGGWSVRLFTPGRSPLDELAAQLAAATGLPAEDVAADLRGCPGRAADYARRADPGSHRLLLVVDQFEEAFTTCVDGTQRQAFVAALCAAAGPGRALIVIGLRADFYAPLLRHPDLVAAVRANQLTVAPMADAELRRAITEPARKAGVEVTDGLVELLLAEVGSGEVSTRAHDAAVLPLLSHALLATWQHSRDRRLTVSDYREVGGIDRAVAASADAVYAEFDEHQRHLARQVFLGLVHIAADAPDTRRRRDWAELVTECDGSTDQVTEVLDRFVAQRLITVDADRVQLSHEALLTAWPLLRDWLEVDRAGMLTRRHVVEAATTWQREQRCHTALYRGARLAVAREWAQRTGAPALNPVAREFLAASVARELAEQHAARRRTRRLRQLVAALTVLFLLATTMTVVAARSDRISTRQRDEAVSRQVAQEADPLRGDNPALANQLSLAAYRLARTPEARGALLSSFAAPYSIRLTGHTGYVHDVKFSPDRRLLASAGSDRTVRLWDTSVAHRPTLRAVLDAASDYVSSVTFSPDSATLVTTSADRMVGLWDVRDPGNVTRIAVLAGHRGSVDQAAFSPDGRVLATASSDRTIRLWDVTDLRRPRPIATLPGKRAWFAVAFSPDGRTLAGGDERDVRLWDVTDPRRPAGAGVLTGHTDVVSMIAYSPDGRTLATGSYDHTARLWDLARGISSSVIRGHTGLVYSVAYSPDGRTLATGSGDATARLWNVTDPRRPVPITVLDRHADEPGDTNAIAGVAFSPDGQTLATGSYDYTVRLWELTGPAPTGQSDPVRPLQFGGDDSRLLLGPGRAPTVRAWTAGETSGLTDPLDVRTDGSVTFCQDSRLLVSANATTVRLSDLDDPRHVKKLSQVPHRLAGDVPLPVCSPDGRLLAVLGARSRAVRLWDIADARHPVTLSSFSARSHTNALNMAVFSTDGRLLATASLDHTARLWDLTDPRRPVEAGTLAGHTDAVNTAAFSPAGRILATGANDGTIWLWDVSDPNRPSALATLTGHTAYIEEVRFSPDGRTLVSSSGDHTVRLWDVGDPRRPAKIATLTGHTATVSAVAFTSDGRRLATAGADGTVRTWDLSLERVAGRVCALAYPTLTRAEWARHFPGIGYRPPCRTAPSG